jgi:hypothetical protein
MVAAAIPDIASVQADRHWSNPRNGKWGYYRRSADSPIRAGYVESKHGVLAPAKAHNADKGWTPLTEVRGVQRRRESPVQPVTASYSNAAARTSSRLQQILNLGWHRSAHFPVDPHDAPVEFRQITRTEDGGLILDDGTVLTEPKCPHCVKPTYFLSEALLRKHESTTHKEISQTDSMVRGMSTATQATAAATAGKLDEAIRVLAAGQVAIAEQMAAAAGDHRAAADVQRAPVPLPGDDHPRRQRGRTGAAWPTPQERAAAGLVAHWRAGA